MLKAIHKQWLSPFIAVMFVVISVSGAFLLFHRKFVGMYEIHQWGGMLFFLGGVLHVFLNWRVLLSYFSNRKAVLGALAGVAIISMLIVLFPNAEHKGKGHGKGYDVQRRSYKAPYNR